ncbi:MAG: hypothetical protein ABI321_23145 [Polyangia bacterium]
MRVLLAASFLALAGCATVKPTTVPDEPRALEATRPAEVVEPVTTPIAAMKEKRSSGTITRAELVAVLDAAPGRFLAHVDTEPHFVSGRFHGWTLASFFPGDTRFEAVDLEPGDVVLTVNGRSIEKPDQLMQVWDSLRRERALIVVVERGGVPHQLRYEILD